MDDFEAMDAMILAVLVLPAVAVSFPTGWRRAAGGASFRNALMAGFGRSFLVVIAVGSLAGAGIARFELAELGEDELWEIEGRGAFSLLVESEVRWVPPCRCRGCRMGGVGYSSDETRHWLIREALSAGYVIPFLAPVFGLLAFVPSAMATAVGFNVGSRRRVVALMGELSEV